MLMGILGLNYPPGSLQNGRDPFKSLGFFLFSLILWDEDFFGPMGEGFKIKRF